MTKPATPKQIRQYHRDAGHEPRIKRDGTVIFRLDPDYHPGCQGNNHWRNDGTVEDYIVDTETGINRK